jgi:hypothetical protein
VEADTFEDAVRNAKRGGVQVRKASNQTLASFGVEYVQKYASVELAAATRATNRACSGTDTFSPGSAAIR